MKLNWDDFWKSKLQKVKSNKIAFQSKETKYVKKDFLLTDFQNMNPSICKENIWPEKESRKRAFFEVFYIGVYKYKWTNKSKDNQLK